MKRNLSHISLMFPKFLMSSSQTPIQMSLDYAREIRNMYAQQGGAGFKRNGVRKIGNALEGTEIVSLMHYVPPSGDIQILAVSDSGCIYLKDDDNWVEKFSGLNSAGKVRWVHYAGKLIICNGLDPVMSWDGDTVSIIHEYVQENGDNLTFVNSTTFTVESGAVFYTVGKELKVTLEEGVTVNGTVSSVSQLGSVTTVTVDEPILTANLSLVEFKEYPPKFNNLYAAHDRLWGMGTGSLKAETFSNSADRTFVFYTDGLGDENKWRDETGSLQYINIADKMPVSDELLAMAVKDGLTVFFGRHYTQVWSGYDPTESGDMTWNKTIPLGIVHGDLIAEMPNDITFFSRYGVRTLTRVLQTEQLDIADLGSEVDAYVTKAVSELMADDTSYKKALSFMHMNQGWFAFKPSQETLVFQLSGSATGWTIFDGIFKDISAALNTPDGKLYMAMNGQLYLYDENIYDDDCADITTKWWTPWIKPNSNGKNWANKYAEVITEQGEPVQLLVKRYKNYNNSSFVNTTVTAHKAEDYWDQATWDGAFWDYGSSKPELARDHYIADVVAYAVESSSSLGPLTIYGLKLFGIYER